MLILKTLELYYKPLNNRLTGNLRLALIVPLNNRPAAFLEQSTRNNDS